MTLLTEAEAKRRWCPLARVESADGNAGSNRYMRDNGEVQTDFAPCLGAACMAWAWHDTERGERAGEKRRGYCAAFHR